MSNAEEIAAQLLQDAKNRVRRRKRTLMLSENSLKFVGDLHSQDPDSSLKAELDRLNGVVVRQRARLEDAERYVDYLETITSRQAGA